MEEANKQPMLRIQSLDRLLTALVITRRCRRARRAYADQYFFAVFQLVDQLLVKLRGFRIRWGVERKRHDLPEWPPGHLVVLVDMRHQQPRRREDQLGMVVEVELKDVVAQFEDDDMLHPQILLDPIHALLSRDVFESVVVLAIESVHDVSLEVFQEVHLVLQFIRVGVDGVRLAHVDRPLSTSSNVIKMSKAFEYTKAEKKREQPTACQDSTPMWCCR